MQDIDFEALDQEVNKIMDQKKQAAEKKARIRQQQGRGRNMDILNTAPQAPTYISRTPIQPYTKPQDLRPSAVKNTTIDGMIRSGRVAKPAPNRQSQPTTANKATAQSTQPAVKASPVAEVAITKTASQSLPARPVQARGANLLRQRRRLNQAGETMMAAVSAPLDKTMLQSSDSLIKGHYQSETLSTKQPDGSETVYQYDSVDYVAKLNPEPAQKPSVVASAPARQVSAHNEPPSSMIDLDELAELEAIHPTEKPAVRSRDNDPVYRDRGQSPFLETAKVDKRPLGVPYDKAIAGDYKSTTLQLEHDQSEEAETALYRGDLSTEPDQPKKWRSIVWVILMILAIIGAAVGIYLMTVYNK